MRRTDHAIVAKQNISPNKIN